MAKRNILVDIDLNKNQLLNAKLQNLATHPTLTASDAGFTYWNTADNKQYSWTGTEWISGGYEHPNHTGDVSSVGDGATTINSNVVTNNKLATVNELTVKGRISAGSGDVEDLSASQVRTLINVENGADVTDAANVNAAGAVMETDYNAYTVLTANSDDTPLPLTITSNSVLGRLSGDIQNITIDNDLSTVSASDDTLPSAKGVKTYVDNAILTNGSLVNKGGYNATTNTPDLDISPSSLIKNGWTYVVTTAGTFFTEDVQVGDMIIATTDSPSTLADWTVVNKNIDDIVDASTSDKGIIQIASTGEVSAATVNNKAITPSSLTSITKLGTISTGTWNGSVISPAYGGTGVNNGSNTLTISSNATVSGTNTGDQTITLSGDITGSGTGAITATLPNIATAGTYNKVVVNSKGQVTSGTTESVISKYAGDVTGNGSSTSFTVNHSLSSTDVVVSVKEATTSDIVDTEVTITDSNNISISFNTAPANGKVYRVTVIG